MIVSDIADTLGASLIASTLGQSERSRSPRAGASDAVSPTSERAEPRVEQQSASTQVSLSASGQLRSSVAQLQESSAALADDTNTPAERSAAAQNFVNAYNNAQAAARSVMSEDEGAIAEDDRAAIANQINRSLDDNSRERLRQIGIASGQDGTLSLDQQRFQRALQNDAQQVGSALAEVDRQVQEATSRPLDAQTDRTISTPDIQAAAPAEQSPQPQETQRVQDQSAADAFNAIAASGIATYQKIFAL